MRIPELVFEKGGEGRGSNAEGRKSRQAPFGLQTQCRRVRLRPPAAGRPMFPRCGNIGEIGRNFRIVEGRESDKNSGKLSLTEDSRFTLSVRPLSATENGFSTLEKTWGSSFCLFQRVENADE